MATETDEIKVIGKILSDKVFRAQFERDPSQTLEDCDLKVDKDRLPKLQQLVKTIDEKVEISALRSEDTIHFISPNFPFWRYQTYDYTTTESD